MTRGVLVPLAVALAAAPALAQSTIANADVQPRPAGNLARTFSELPAGPEPFWIGYSVRGSGSGLELVLLHRLGGSRG